jgi:leucyl-tRNA synthetase
MDYNFRELESKWQQNWVANKTYKTELDKSKEKFYVLDMFPYPSGAGLHVGHPLGYIASDIYARYKKLSGYNVLHPMGFDAYGLPAEQYAIQTGQHPAVTTEVNLKRYREQLDKLGFSFDWDREVQTCKPDYYKWTQWIFIQLFNSWYNKATDKAEKVETLIAKFEANGTADVKAHNDAEHSFTADDWKSYTEDQQYTILLDYRIAYLADTQVNWCPELGTVLANDEIKDGLSERGGHPVEKKNMMQWNLRITAYSQRLIDGLDKLDWTDSIKEIQKNWIGRSEGAMLRFPLKDHKEEIEVFTTRPDTIFGVTFMTLAPEHPLVAQITTDEYKADIAAYIKASSTRSERERMADVKTISGQFTGAYVLNPFDGTEIPVWIGDYVLAGYGTGAVMAVPCGDERDWNFAKHFNLPIPAVFEGMKPEEGADPTKDAKMINSDFLNGLTGHEAMVKATQEAEKQGFGEGKINYRLRDAICSRQRYWGEPFPVYYKGNTPYVFNENELPLELPEVDKYLPTKDGEPPLARAKNWEKDGNRLEYNTMPGWAGSSWYFLRYLDPKNSEEFASKEAIDYWQNVDLYFGGSEHATGHLLYSRFWTKFLYDLDIIPFDEPFKKMINQGMILGKSAFVYRDNESGKYLSKNLVKGKNTTPIHVDVAFVKGDVLDTDAFKNWRAEFNTAEFELEDGKYIVGSEVEKMSKSKFNVVNPDDIIAEYGADTLRMYEMFLGPLEAPKPWDTKGIEGVYRFLRKFWNLYQLNISDDKATDAELKVLHKTIKKITEDITRFSFNTCISTFMVCVNELAGLKCNKKEVLEQLAVLISPFAPHIAEEVYSQLGNTTSVTKASFPVHNESYLVENNHTYPVSFNGKMRFKLDLSADMSKEDIEKAVLENEQSQKWLNGTPKKVIVVPKKIVNIVI